MTCFDFTNLFYMAKTSYGGKNSRYCLCVHDSLHFKIVVQSISDRLTERGKKKREMIDQLEIIVSRCVK